MNDNKLFTVRTSMEKKDYRNFLYIAIFLKNKIKIPVMILFIAFLSTLLAYSENEFYIKDFFIYFIILIIVFILTIIFKIEVKIKQRIKTDKLGTFNSQGILDFYESFLTAKSTVIEGESKIKYDQFYKVFETKNYFINYFNIDQAALIRKKDMENKTIESLRNLYKNNIKNKYKRVKI
ncbi:YcxB family protein [[Clostridium] dakarense]|uniref:YcxB family protein n=1 Tax=Faecalimicrobium dakarense TaxID=1301100 RepID=UPI0004B44FC3|nr:YcxB family protein [[Clostridium] dakarense]